MRQLNHIIWNGKSSLDFGIRILDKEIPRPSPGLRHERIQIDGRDGDLYVDLRSIPSVPYDLPVHLLDVYEAQRITDWLRQNPQGDLLLSWDDDYIYRAVYLDNHEIENKLIKLGKTTLKFRLHPWKYLKSGQREVTVSTITNPTIYDSKPIYKITGTGDVQIKINDDPFNFKSLSGTIIVDTEKDLITGEGMSPSNVLTYPFPPLRPGENIFNREIALIPNWRARL